MAEMSTEIAVLISRLDGHVTDCISQREAHHESRQVLHKAMSKLTDRLNKLILGALIGLLALLGQDIISKLMGS